MRDWNSGRIRHVKPDDAAQADEEDALMEDLEDDEPWVNDEIAKIWTSPRREVDSQQIKRRYQKRGDGQSTDNKKRLWDMRD